MRVAAAEHRRLAQAAAERGNAYDKPIEPLDPMPTGPVTKPPPIHSDLDLELGAAEGAGMSAGLAAGSFDGADMNAVSFANPVEPEPEQDSSDDPAPSVVAGDASLIATEFDEPSTDGASFEAAPDFAPEPSADVAFADLEPDEGERMAPDDAPTEFGDVG